MWAPVNLNNPKPRQAGLREALVASIAASPHYRLVSHGSLDGQQLPKGEEAADAFVRSFEESSLAYVGCSHMKPVAPFCAFSVASELGIARIEHLVDYGALPRRREKDKWLTNAIASFLVVLFLEHPNIRQVALPVSVAEESFGDFSIKYIDGVAHAIRT